MGNVGMRTVGPGHCLDTTGASFPSLHFEIDAVSSIEPLFYESVMACLVFSLYPAFVSNETLDLYGSDFDYASLPVLAGIQFGAVNESYAAYSSFSCLFEPLANEDDQAALEDLPNQNITELFMEMFNITDPDDTPFGSDLGLANVSWVPGVGQGRVQRASEVIADLEVCITATSPVGTLHVVLDQTYPSRVRTIVGRSVEMMRRTFFALNATFGTNLDFIDNGLMGSVVSLHSRSAVHLLNLFGNQSGSGAAMIDATDGYYGGWAHKTTDYPGMVERLSENLVAINATGLEEFSPNATHTVLLLSDGVVRSRRKFIEAEDSFAQLREFAASMDLTLKVVCYTPRRRFTRLLRTVCDEMFRYPGSDPADVQEVANEIADAVSPYENVWVTEGAFFL